MRVPESATFVAEPVIVGIVAAACNNDPAARAIADKEHAPDFNEAEAETQAFWRCIARAALKASEHWQLYEALTAAANALQHQARMVTEHGSSPVLLGRQKVIQEQADAAFAALAKARGEA